MAYSDFGRPYCTEAEKELIAAVRSGLPAEFANGEVIRADLIRKLMLGLPPSPDEDPVPTPCGVRVVGAVIQGPLNLNNARGEHGSVMPGLLMDDCIVEDLIDISYAQLGKLSIERSKITELRGVRAVIQGELIANDISPAIDGGYCFLSLHSLHVDGDVQVRRAHLVETPELDNYKAEQFALNLRGATINGTVYFREARCSGTVNISLARIEGNFTARSATITPRVDGTAAIIADDVIIKGVFSTRTPTDGMPFKAAGWITLTHGHLGAATLDGAIINLPRPTQSKSGNEQPAVDFHDTRIKGNLYFRRGFYTNGIVDLRNVDIEAALAAEHAFFAKGMRAIALKVGGDVDLTDVEAGEEINLQDAAIGRMLKISGLKADLDLQRAHSKTFEDGGECKRSTTLKLDGFTYERLETLRGKHDTEEAWKMRLRWLARQGLGYSYYNSPFNLLKWFRGEPRIKVDRAVYRPQPFVQLARVLENTGMEAESRRILRARQWLEINAGMVLWGIPQVLFGTLFGFGYSSARAIVVLLIYFLIGWIGVHAAQAQHMLVFDNQVAAVYADTSRAPVLPVLAGSSQSEIPCNDIDAYGYALDLMIPLDLHIEGKCEIKREVMEPQNYVSATVSIIQKRFGVEKRRLRLPQPIWPVAAQWWRFLHIAYAIIGWIVVSLAILTFSGLLRQKERIT